MRLFSQTGQAAFTKKCTDEGPVHVLVIMLLPLKSLHLSWSWWLRPIILPFVSLRQDDQTQKFSLSLGKLMRPCFRILKSEKRLNVMADAYNLNMRRLTKEYFSIAWATYIVNTRPARFCQKQNKCWECGLVLDLLPRMLK